MKTGGSNANNFTFDKDMGNFIVMVELTPEQYSQCASEQIITDISTLKFNKETGNFNVGVYMTPEEYSNYVQDGIIPKRYLYRKI